VAQWKPTHWFHSGSKVQWFCQHYGNSLERQCPIGWRSWFSLWQTKFDPGGWLSGELCHVACWLFASIGKWCGEQSMSYWLLYELLCWEVASECSCWYDYLLREVVVWMSSTVQ
jgi:hypothetical protein